jgi:hypothetical protein
VDSIVRPFSDGGREYNMGACRCCPVEIPRTLLSLRLEEWGTGYVKGLSDDSSKTIAKAKRSLIIQGISRKVDLFQVTGTESG